MRVLAGRVDPVRRLLICVAAALAIGTPVAAAAVADGTFKGKVKHASKIKIKVAGNELTKIDIPKLPLKCNNGTTYPDHFTYEGNDPIPDDGKLTIDSDSYGGARKATIVIKFTDDGKATGTIRRSARFSKIGFADPEGPTKCKSGKRKFSAKRK
jgi:hypothetical protein